MSAPRFLGKCRRVVSDLGAPPVYCMGDRRKPSPLEWCDSCLARLPFWPGNETPADEMHPMALASVCQGCGAPRGGPQDAGRRCYTTGLDIREN